MSSPDDDLDRDAILARRRHFIAAALSGLALSQTACAETRTPGDAAPAADAPLADAYDARPTPCLPFFPDAGPDATPMPCLGAKLPDAGSDAGDDAEPMPCLDIVTDGGR